MRVFFDASVLVPAVSDQLPQHAAARTCLSSHIGRTGGFVCTSTHALAECYATLTALPLRRRISGPDALRLIEANFMRHLRLIAMGQTDTLKALRLVAGLGQISGRIYDALHLVAAQKAGCRRLYTYNLAHFRSLGSALEITQP